jgi:hypothetical protein
VPWLVLVGHTTGRNNLLAFTASSCELFLVACSAVDVVIFGDKAFRSNCSFAQRTTETFVMPLFALVFHLFHARSENLATTVAPCGKGLVVAVSTEDPIILRPKWLVDQGNLALVAQEALFVPVFVLVGQVLGVNADGFAAIVARIRESFLIALDAIGMLVFKNIPLACECLITLPTAEMVAVPVLVHGFGVLAGED